MAQKLNADGWLDLQAYKEVFIDRLFADVAFCFNNQKWLAGGLLLMSAIDVVSGIERSGDKVDTGRHDFIAWADQYLCLEGPEYKLTGVDIYAARCGLLHSYSPNAKLVRDGKAVTLGWVDQCNPPVRSNEDRSLVIASMGHLFEAVLAGAADSMSRINRDESLAILVNARLEQMFRMEKLDAGAAAALSGRTG